MLVKRKSNETMSTLRWVYVIHVRYNKHLYDAIDTTIKSQRRGVWNLCVARRDCGDLLYFLSKRVRRKEEQRERKKAKGKMEQR